MIWVVVPLTIGGGHAAPEGSVGDSWRQLVTWSWHKIWTSGALEVSLPFLVFIGDTIRTLVLQQNSSMLGVTLFMPVSREPSSTTSFTSLVATDTLRR